MYSTYVKYILDIVKLTEGCYTCLRQNLSRTIIYNINSTYRMICNKRGSDEILNEVHKYDSFSIYILLFTCTYIFGKPNPMTMVDVDTVHLKVHK